jgi:FAD synthase
MEVVAGVEALRPEHGPIFAVIGVFDGLHRGHAYLLDHLVREARARDARPTVITFDHHPDEVLTGSAPPLLLHPDERLERLADAKVEVTVVQHFDEAVRRTTYDAFIDTIRRRTKLAGLLMTPDTAFGFERRGTAEALTELGKARGFDVVVVPPYTRLLGRPVGLRGTVDDGRLTFDLPMATPPDGVYPCQIVGRTGTVTVHDGTIWVEAVSVEGPVRVELTT